LGQELLTKNYRPGDSGPTGPVAENWVLMVRLFELIDSGKMTGGLELRDAVNRVVKTDVPLRDRCLALIPVLRPLHEHATLQ
jgi:hypothetical protein